MRRSHSVKRKIFRYAAILFLVIFLFAAVLTVLTVWEKNQGVYPDTLITDTTVEYNGKRFVLNKDVETFLVMGLDKFDDSAHNDSYNNNQQADFLMLLVFDNQAKKCTGLHINRDAMVEMNVLGVAGEKVDTVTKQIALAHTYGNGREISCRNTADAVSTLLKGSKINHYMSLTMDSVAILNDMVGGVEVEVLEDFTGIDDTLVKGEKVILKGEHALNYVRTRYGLENSSNSIRMNRQKQYMQALYSKLISCIEDDGEFVSKAAVKMADYIVSDRSVNQLSDIGSKFSEYDFLGIENIKGESKSGKKFIEFYPDDDSVKELVIKLFYKLEE